MRDLCRRIAHATWFHTFILVVILVNAAQLGIETLPEVEAAHHTLFEWSHRFVLAVFVVELLIHFVAAKSVKAFFADGWNWFDVGVVALSCVPATGATATVARLARVLRAARLFEVLPDLRIIVNTMLRSVRAMGHVVIMILFLLYTYGIVGYHLFHDVDKENWGTLGQAMWTLFQTITLEAWVDRSNKVAIVPGQGWFFGSFLVLATYTVVNLFVAVVVTNLQDIKAEQQAAADDEHPENDLLDQLVETQAKLKALEERVRRRG